MPKRGSGDSDIVYVFSGDASDLEATLSSIDGSIDESAKKATKSGKAFQGSLQKTGTSAAKTGKSLDDLGEAAGTADGRMKALAGAVGVVSPEMGAALTAAGDLAGGFEILTLGGGSLLAVLGPVTIAVAALAGTYLVLAGNIEKAEQAEKDALTTLVEVQNLSRLLKLARLDEAQALGEVSAAEAEATRIRLGSADAMGEMSGRYNEVSKELKTYEANLASGIITDKRLIGIAEEKITALAKEKRGLEARQGLLKKIAASQVRLTEIEGVGIKTSTAATADKEKADTEELARKKALTAASAKAQAQITAMSEKSAMAIFKANADLFERLNALRSDNLAKLQEALATALSDAELTNEARLSLEESYLQAEALLQEEHQLALDELNAQARAQEDKDREGTTKKQAAALQERYDNAKANTAALAALASNFEDLQGNTVDRLEARLEESGEAMTESERKQLERRIELHKKAASAAAGAQKAAGVVSVAISTSEAIMKAFAQLGPVAGAAAAIGLGLAGGIEAGAILSQPTEFHVGGMIGASASGPGDEVLVKATDDEAILTGRGVDTVGGPEAVREANLGRRSSGYARNQEDFRPFLQDHKRLSAEYSARSENWTGRVNPYV